MGGQGAIIGYPVGGVAGGNVGGVTRIVAGTLGGRRLTAPAGAQTRPTSDRVREALFNTLASLTELSGARFADLYAGSGAVGLEACSRGADHVLLVESDQRAARTIRANIDALGMSEIVRLVGRPVATTLTAGPDTAFPYDVVFADPPYAMADQRLLEMQQALLAHGWLAPGAVVVIERSSRSPALQWVEPLTEVDTRRYGETTLWYGQRS